MTTHPNKELELTKGAPTNKGLAPAEKASTRKERFARNIEAAINRNSMENGSNTPDFVLSAFLVRVLEAFDACVRQRDEWQRDECWGSDIYRGPTKKVIVTTPDETPADNTRHAVAGISRADLSILEEVLKERGCQFASGYDAAHDDKLTGYQLPRAAAVRLRVSGDWPFDTDPGSKDYRHSLIEAAAFCMAEIARFDRKTAKDRGE